MRTASGESACKGLAGKVGIVPAVTAASATARRLPESEEGGGSKITHVSSMASYIGGALWTACGPAKSGMVQLGKNCASAWAKDNIQVNAILLG